VIQVGRFDRRRWGSDEIDLRRLIISNDMLIKGMLKDNRMMAVALFWALGFGWMDGWMAQNRSSDALPGAGHEARKP
jgi:hypothetical protein